jgi:hypothetical protein
MLVIQYNICITIKEKIAMAIIKVYNKERDTTYVYDSYSYWDKEKKQPRSKRKLIGKIDPVSGEIVPTGKRGRAKSSPSPTASAVTHSDTDYAALYEQSLNTISDKDALINDLRQEIAALSRENQRLRKVFDQTFSLMASVR